MDDDADLIAAFDAATGEFVDLVRSDAGGLFFRENGDWLPYQPGDLTLDGAEAIDVDPDFVQFCDRAQAGRHAPSREDALKFQPHDGQAEDAA